MRITTFLGVLVLAGCASSTPDPTPSKTTPTTTTTTKTAPTIVSISPTSGTWGTEVTITGTALGATVAANTINFGSFSAVVTSASPTTVKVIVPATLNIVSSLIKLQTADGLAMSPNSFNLLPPEITSFSVSEAKRNATVVISGNNFAPEVSFNNVTFGSYAATVTGATNTTLTVKLPDFVGLEDSDIKVAVTVLNQPVSVQKDFKLLGPWKQIASLPGPARGEAVAFVIDGKGYVGTGQESPADVNSSKGFYRYDPATNTWSAIQRFQFTGFGSTSPYYNLIGIGFDTKAVVGFGSSMYTGIPNKVETYDPVNDSWSMTSGITDGDQVEGAVTYSIGNKGYLVGGLNSTAPTTKVWQYIPGTGLWETRNDFPGTARWEAAGFAIGSKGHLVGGISCKQCSGFELNDHWEYDQPTDTWTQRPNFPGTKRTRATGFSLNGTGFLLGGQRQDETKLKDFWYYNPATQTWTQWTDMPGSGVASAVAFVIGDKAYIGTGLGPTDYLSTFWQFDGAKF